MTALLSRLTNLGVHEKLTDLEKRTIQLINIIAIISIAIAILGIILTLILYGFVFWGILSGIICIVNYIIVLRLNSKSKFNYAKILIVIYTNVSFLLVTLTMDYRIRPDMLFLTSFPVFVAMFHKVRTIIWVSFVTIIVLEIGIYLQVLGYVEPATNADDYNLTMLYFPQVAIVATIILLVTIFFKQTSEQYQLKLEASNNELANSLEVNQNQKKQLEKSLEENVFLFKEVHHRVKNNMQIVSGLLDLQLKKVKDKEAKEALIQSSKRINAMSLVHQQLYQTDSVEKVPLKSFITQLTSNIKNLSTDKDRIIEYLLDIDDITVNLDTAIPFGLIINELISNSYKHAFKDLNNSKGLISISIKTKKEQLVMKVQDNGQGISEVDNLNATNSLGLFLVDLLVGQLDGEITKENNNGLLNIIRIPYEA